MVSSGGDMDPKQTSEWRPITFVLLEQPVGLDLPSVVAAIRARHPGLSVRIAGDNAQSNSTLLECDGELVALMSIAAPMPRDDAIAARAEATWPEAATIINSHRAHLVISTVARDLGRLRAARMITAIVGSAVAAVPGCLAVLWDDSVAHPAARWLDMSRSAFAPYPDFPFMLWLSIHPFHYDSMIVAVTFGLSAFVGREIEFEGKGLDLPKVINKVAGLSVYLIERGSVIPDGDTFGGSERERLRIHHAISKRFSGLPVLLASTAAR